MFNCKIINKQEQEKNQDSIFSFDYIQLEKNETEKREDQGQKMKDKKKEQNELKPVDIFSLNEIMISERLMKLKGWQKYTNPILHSSLVSGIGKYLFVKEQMDFSLLSFLHHFAFPMRNQHHLPYPYSNPRILWAIQMRKGVKDKKGKTNRREKEEGMVGELKETFIQILCIYHSLLKVLEWTESVGLVSLSCNLNNIVFDRDKMVHVKLADFSHSFFIGDIGKDNIDLSAFMMLIQINEFTPLGLKVLHYLKMNKCESLSSNNIQEICSEFIEGLKRFGPELLPLEFLQEVEKKCIFSLYSLINKEKERIVVELLKGSSYWDHFSMSIMFLIILKIINNSHAEFIEILLNNIMYSIKNNELTFC